MATDTIRASGVASLATKKVMQGYSHMKPATNQYRFCDSFIMYCLSDYLCMIYVVLHKQVGLAQIKIVCLYRKKNGDEQFQRPFGNGFSLLFYIENNSGRVYIFHEVVQYKLDKYLIIYFYAGRGFIASYSLGSSWGKYIYIFRMLIQIAYPIPKFSSLKFSFRRFSYCLYLFLFHPDSVNKNSII